MKDDGLIFKVTSREALLRFNEFLFGGLVPSPIALSLSRFVDEGVEYPLYLTIDGLEFTKDTEGSTEEENPIVVRTKEVLLNAHGVSKVIRHGLDLYPKFKRVDWVSGRVAFRLSSVEELEDFGKKLGFSIPSLSSYFLVGLPMYAVVNGSSVKYLKDKPTGTFVEDYNLGYKFKTPLVRL